MIAFTALIMTVSLLTLSMQRTSPLVTVLRDMDM
jgi:hypothetical protein